MKSKTATTRRGFFWRAGAALSAPLAVATAEAAPGADDDAAALRARLERLEDLDAIRELNRAWTRGVNAGTREELAGLFADPADAPIADGIRSVSADRSEEQDIIEISTGRRTATARLYRVVQVETPIEPDCPLVDMARKQGGGVIKRSERGIFENSYAKRDGVWKLERTAYRPAS